MSLEALAPDQRAVVQLVLQQERTYEELAGLLGISTDAVRERAHNGLARLATGVDVPEDQRAQVADYLLAQQSVSKREATRSLLSSSPEAREWAQTVAGELRGVAAGPLPEIPGGATARVRAPEPEPEAEPEPAPEPVRREPVRRAPAPEPEPVTAEAPAAPAVRARPRPRPERERERPSTTPPARPPVTDGAKRSSKLGGALLIGGVAIALVALIVLLVGGGSDDNKDNTKTTGAVTATPTASATSSFQPVGQIPLAAVGGGKQKGAMVLFQSPDNSLAFTIQATNMPQSKRGEAYAVWLVGGSAPHRLGFAPAVGADGKFGTSGPRSSDAKNFAKWLTEAKQVVVSRETNQNATQPGPVVLGGDVPQPQGQG